MNTNESGSKNILLLYPKVPEKTYWSYSYALNLLGKRALQPPLGLLTVAGMFPQGYTLKLKDLNIESCSEEEMMWADAVLISAMIAQKDSFIDCINRAKGLGGTVIAGGAYPSTSYREIHNVDYFILGEAESVFTIFLRDWEQGEAKHVYARSSSHAEILEMQDYFTTNADIKTISSKVCLDESPLPRFDLLDFDAYQTLAIQISRGCPHGCEFCDIWQRFGKKMRYKSIPHILAELSELFRLGWRSSIFIVDDNFVGNPRITKEILNSIIAWQDIRGYPFDFSTEASISLADDNELLRLLAQAGFDMVFLGLETPVEASLKEAGKYVNTVGNMSERVKRIQGAGIQVTSGFILGFDSEPDNIAERMIDCIEDMGIPVAMVGILQALPGTELHKRLENEKRLICNSDGNNTHEFSLCFIPRRPVEDLIFDYKSILKSLYPNNLKSYFTRCALLRAHWQPPLCPRQPLNWYKIKLFIRYLFTSLCYPYFLFSLWFLIVTTLTKPSFLPVAVSLGIQGHHFRNITRLAFRMEELKYSYKVLYEQFIAKINREKSVLKLKLSNYTTDNEVEIRKQLNYHILTIEKAHDLLVKKISRRFKRFPRFGRNNVRSIYISCCNKINRALSDFRDEAGEILHDKI